MTRKQLEALGLEKEAVDRVLDLNGQEVAALNAQLATAQKEAEGLQSQVAERDTQLRGLQALTGDAEAFKQQITQLTEQNTAQAAQHQQELKTLRMDAAVERALTGAKAKNLTAAKALLGEFLSGAELDDAGSVKGLEESLQKLVKGADTAFLFDTSKSTASITGAAPANTPAGIPGAKQDPSKMTYDAYAALVAAGDNT
jgi:hypothetical protein